MRRAVTGLVCQLVSRAGQSVIQGKSRCKLKLGVTLKIRSNFTKAAHFSPMGTFGIVNAF
jgi:hypothetical protein